MATDNEMVRDILLAVLSSLARQESRRLSERVRAGMARAREQGVHLGRPAVSERLRQDIRARLAAGASAYRVAKDLGVSGRTVRKYAQGS